MDTFPVDLPANDLAVARELKIRPADIEERFIRGGGSGGQKINKTNSCVELIHKPSGTVVRVQRHREQSRNRLSAYKQLIRRIEDEKQGAASRRAKKIFKLKKQKQRRSKRAKEKILEQKRQRSDLKESRKKII